MTFALCQVMFSCKIRNQSKICFSVPVKVREWFSEVQRRVDTGSDPFQEPVAGRTNGDREDEEGGGEAQQKVMANEEQTGAGMGEEDEEEEEDEEDDGEDTDDSEVWEPSRSVRKSLSVSED